MPSSDSLKWELTGRGIPSEGFLSETAVDRFIEVFIDTLDFAGLLDGSKSDDQVDIKPQNDIVQKAESTNANLLILLLGHLIYRFH